MTTDKANQPARGCYGPWKVEVTMYDHPNAASVAVGDSLVLPDDTIIVPISVTWKGPFTGYDWFEVESATHLNLVSHDRGTSWRVLEEQVADPGADLRSDRFGKSFLLPDGSRLRIKWLGYVQHPMEELAQWEQAGYWAYLVPERNAFSTTAGFVVETSRDDGKTWESRDIELPFRAFLAGYGMTTTRMLSDGTIIMPVFGYPTRRHKTYSCGVIRSTDQGRTWELMTIAEDRTANGVADADLPSGSIWAQFTEALGFDECGIAEGTKPGRVVAVMEESHSKKIYCCLSDDFGKTWSKPRLTGMIGNTPFLLRLQSGAIACAYTNRYHGPELDRGWRVCYSHDDGETWEADNPAILHDWNARPNGQCIWNIAQFSDGTLFASGWATKTGCGGGEQISYALGCRFTEDYRTPNRMMTAPSLEGQRLAP